MVVCSVCAQSDWYGDDCDCACHDEELEDEEIEDEEDDDLAYDED